MNAAAGRPGRRLPTGASAKALLLTVLGELVLPSGGAVWTSTVVRGLATLDVEERNARQALARTAEDGTLTSQRLGRRARWHLTDRGRRLLVEGTRRIYGLGGDDGDGWDRRWLVVLCSVPEDQRAKRHRLRARLEFAGFGFLGAGVAVSPHVEREDEANEILRDLQLVPGAVVFRAEAGSLAAPEEVLARAWDLDRLAADYRAFATAFGARRPGRDDEHFAALVELVHAWRRFPFADPGIPPALLPPAWPGHAAHDVFVDRHEAWSPTARRWFAEAEGRETSS